MKIKLLSSFLAVFLTCSASTTSTAVESDPVSDTGLSVAQLRTIANSLPASPGGIQAIQFLRKDGFWIDRAAFLIQERDSGWQIFVFHRESNDKIALEWKSGKLDDSFATSSPDQFQIVVAASENALKFSGCAAHDCPDVFSVVLYIPSKKTAFSATYIWGEVTYSPASDGSNAQFYKASLDRFIAEHRSITGKVARP
jgi:hypothetical protein